MKNNQEKPALFLSAAQPRTLEPSWAACHTAVAQLDTSHPAVDPVGAVAQLATLNREKTVRLAAGKGAASSRPEVDSFPEKNFQRGREKTQLLSIACPDGA